MCVTFKILTVVFLQTMYFIFTHFIILQLFFPGSLSACDSFLNAFEAKGLKPEALCPCASSTETMTVGLRR